MTKESIWLSVPPYTASLTVVNGAVRDAAPILCRWNGQSWDKCRFWHFMKFGETMKIEYLTHDDPDGTTA